MSKDRPIAQTGIAHPGRSNKLIFFVSNMAMDIDGMGETHAALFNQGLVRSTPDFYCLKEHKQEMMLMDGIGEKAMPP